MRSRQSFFLWIFLVVLAPIGAVVIVSALLLFGVHPQVVFAPGRGIKSLLEDFGFHPAKSVAVASTVFLWWLLFATIGLVRERRARN